MTSRNAHCVSGSLDGTSKGARKIGLEERSESRQNAIYAKTGGKNRKNLAVSKSSSISAVSWYLGLQIFEFMYARKFRSVCEATSNKAISTDTFNTISLFTRFQDLWDSSSSLDCLLNFHSGTLKFPRFPEWNAIIKLFRKRGGNQEDD